MTSVSSSDSRKRQRALDSRGLFGDQMGSTLSIPSDSPKDISDPKLDEFDDGDDGDGRASRHRKRSRSRSRSRSKSRSPLRKRATPGVPDGPSANVCMVKKSGVGTIRGWMKHGIESKQEVVTLRSSYKPSFEGSFELMAPELDPSMVRKWLRNIGDTSEKPKLKDFWEKNLLTLHREIKDVFEPLIYLLNSVTESNEAHLPAQTATRLLGHVFAHMTQMRRFNAMRHVAPKFSSMVMDPLLFSSREHRYLFGEKFITALDKEAEMDSKMDKIGRYGGHSSSRKGNYSNRKGDQQSSGSRSNNYSSNNNKDGANWNWGKQQPQKPKGKQRHGSYQNNKYVKFSSSVSDDSFVGGRLSLFIDTWRVLTDDRWVLDIIEYGYKIEFHNPPVQDKWPSEILLDVEKSAICDAEVKALSAKAQLLLLRMVVVLLATFLSSRKRLKANLGLFSI